MATKKNSKIKSDLNPPAPYLDLPFMTMPELQFEYAPYGTVTGSGDVVYNADGSTSVTGTKTFTSHVVSPGENISTMVQFDAVSLLRPGADLSGGIKCRTNGGKVVLSVYSYDSSCIGGKGNILYRLSTTTTNTSDFTGEPENIPSPLDSGAIGSDQIRTLLHGAHTWLVDRSKCASLTEPDLLTATMAYINGQTEPIQTPLNDCLRGNNYTLLQPVIVEVEVTDATVMYQGLKFPGLAGEFDLADYFDPERILKVVFTVNDGQPWTYSAADADPHIQSLVLGDSIHFEVLYRGRRPPQIKGVPAVWIARFAGDLMYYCSPNVSPGEFQPWIGYDSQVHHLQMRNYKGDPLFEEKVPDWTNDGNNTWYWGWTVQRRMDHRVATYQAEYTWPKYKVLKDGGIQRNNQREGLNLQFLNYWQQGAGNSDFREYAGAGKYMMGFDDDELLYLNSRCHDAVNNPPLEGEGIAKLDILPSRSMPEGPDQIYDVGTGYPAQGFPLNMVISAYRKNREWVINGNGNYHQRYDGYEIQDVGTCEEHPDGIGAGNKVAPGKITIRAGNRVVTIPINVRSPLSEEYGFYGNLEGNRWPAYYETDMPYTLTGLKGLETAVLDGFSMECQGSDSLGNLCTQTKYLKDLSGREKDAVASTGRWTALFDNIHPTYACVTAYYQRTTESGRVMIAGKELKSTFLLFIGEKSLEGKGHGAKIWLHDFRETPTAEYHVPREFGNIIKYMSPFVRTYVFPVHTTTTFESWDGDPHLFHDPGIDWYLSSRTLARRIPDSYLDGTGPNGEEPYLNYYINGVQQTAGRKGKEFTHTWAVPGEYTLKTEYRIDGDLTARSHKIIIVDYPSSSLGKQIGRITFRDLSAQEVRWLDIPDPFMYKVAEVVDVYSRYKYKDGPRTNSPFINRWAEHNDYAAQYVWSRANAPFVQEFLARYNNLDWLWLHRALHYSSNWMYNLPDGLPPYVPNERVTRVIKHELDRFSGTLDGLFSTARQAKWQYVVPLISYTDYQGNRMRTNPSCLYDLDAVWSNAGGAFSGKVVLPDDPNQMLSPDITDEQKDRQEFYYALKSGRMAVFCLSNSDLIHVTVRNVYGGQDIFIAEGTIG